MVSETNLLKFRITAPKLVFMEVSIAIKKKGSRLASFA